LCNVFFQVDAVYAREELFEVTLDNLWLSTVTQDEEKIFIGNELKSVEDQSHFVEQNV
jgi:hypothetical protein